MIAKCLTRGRAPRDRVAASQPMKKIPSRRLVVRVAALILPPLPLLVPGCGNESADPPSRPNVLLISLDSTRRDLLSAYGYRSPYNPELSSSPNLDRLAREGVLFENAYATTSWTLPSHVSMFTGQPELVHAVDIDYHRPDPRLPTMAEVFASHGYRTAGFYSGLYLEPHFGLDRGFSRYESCYGDALSRGAANKAAAEERLAGARSSGEPAAIADAEEQLRRASADLDSASHRDVSSRFVADAVLSELERAGSSGEPFFIFAHFFDPHYDYKPPDPFGTDFDPDYQGDIDGLDFIQNRLVADYDVERPGGRNQVCSDRDLAHIRALYAGELAWTDNQIGRILEGLATHGFDTNTLVILTADHGDEFFEHGSLGHRLSLYEESVAVPLILRLPGRLPAGRRVKALASTIDILPTALDLAGLPGALRTISPGLTELIDGQDDGAGRGVFGRIVRTFAALIPVPPGEVEGDRVAGRLVRIVETYRQGSIKITRTRRWNITNASVSQETESMLEERGRKQRDREFLVWIDLERHPDEPLDRHSSDFSDPIARAALRQFHDRYAELLANRSRAAIRQNDAFLELLRGLGYLDAGSENPLSSDLFRLPPPGTDLLGR